MAIETGTTDPALIKHLSRKALWHLMPLLGFLCFVSMLDRISLAFAGPHGMNEDLALTATMFGFVVGVFTIGYVLVEVPTAGWATKMGPRRWIIRVLLVWGAIQCLIAFAPNYEILVVLRFLLGAAEGGFAPAIFYFITMWFVRSYRPFGFMLIGGFYSLASIVGPILGAGIISMGNAGFLNSLSGWRILLLILGLLAIVAAIPASIGLVESPSKARWLSDPEKEQYAKILSADAEVANTPHKSVIATIRDWRPWVIGMGYFGVTYAMFTIYIWTPTMVSQFAERFGTTFNVYQSALLAGLPTLIAVAYNLVMSRLAGRRGWSGKLVASGAVIGAIGALWTIVADGPVLLLIALSFVGIAGLSGAFYMPMVSRIFAGAGGYSAIAIVNSLGASASFVSPVLTGYLIDVTGNTNAGFFFIAGLLVMSAFLGLMAERLAKEGELDDVVHHSAVGGNAIKETRVDAPRS
ncbi:MFS transporter [Rhodococcus sp. T7]|uniref:MFS transporter n=1 Tax=Rhodococcus sp. T7 TaxID=627444 RepID=UPI00135A9178|nr:MFS transporter [Rhodococcus sp. T7]KAF0957989.1 putative tartrate transporter [Rhodococcus sp. T7]KAF0960148.1 putative tartrate transporter [Rhodococcus sp. T7]